MILLDLVSKGLLNDSKIHTLSGCVLIHRLLKSFLLHDILAGTWCQWCTTSCHDKKPTAGQLKEKPDEKGLIYVYSQLSKYTAELASQEQVCEF